MSKPINIYIPTAEEDAAINAGIAADPDALEASAEHWAAMRPVRGRPRKSAPKAHVSLRLDPDILAHYKASGAGWQTRLNNDLRHVIQPHTR